MNKSCFDQVTGVHIRGPVQDACIRPVCQVVRIPLVHEDRVPGVTPTHIALVLLDPLLQADTGFPDVLEVAGTTGDRVGPDLLLLERGCVHQVAPQGVGLLER